MKENHNLILGLVVNMEDNRLVESIRVILANNHAMVREGIRQFLEQAKDILIVGEAEDGEIALELIKQFEPHVAVLDIQMSKLSSLQILQEICTHRLPVGVLILTSFDDEATMSIELTTAARGFVLKTASPNEIINAVRKVYAAYAPNRMT
jgi:DNA-binding NarL/FixJ family response regulator